MKRQKRVEFITTRRVQMLSQVNNTNRDSKKIRSNLESVSKSKIGRGIYGVIRTQPKPTSAVMEVLVKLAHHWTILRR